MAARLADRPATRSDCARCAALCCIAFPAEEMPGFAASKAAGEPCPKLGGDGRCTIYDTRSENGFGGCVAFECFGAGQHVVQTLFDARDWRDDPRLLPQMVETFLAMRPVSELLYLVDHARGQPEADAHADALDTIDRDLQAIAQSRATLRETDRVPDLRSRLRDILASLRREGSQEN